ncbi:PAS domain S-box protein [Cryobacterium sp. Hz16]
MHSFSAETPAASAELLARAFAATARMSLITDAQQNILHVGNSFTTITGYGADEVLGRNTSTRFYCSHRCVNRPHDADGPVLECNSFPAPRVPRMTSSIPHFCAGRKGHNAHAHPGRRPARRIL